MTPGRPARAADTQPASQWSDRWPSPPFPAADAIAAAAALTEAAAVLGGPHPTEVRYRAVVEQATVELHRMQEDADTGRDPELMLWRLAVPGALGALGAEERPTGAPGWPALVAAWVLLGFATFATAASDLVPYGWQDRLPVAGVAALVAAAACLVVALVARARRGRVTAEITARHHRLVTLEARLVGPLARLRAATRPADFAGPASRAAVEVTGAAARLTAAAQRLGTADAVVDRLGTVVTGLVAVLPEISGEARAVAAPFTAAAERIEISTATLGAAAASLRTALAAMERAIEQANWLALVADGLRHDPDHDPTR